MFREDILLNFILIGVPGVIFFTLGYFLRKYTAQKKVKKAEEKAKVILQDAEREAASRHREIEVEAKNTLFNLRQDFEKETKERKQELLNLEKRVIQRDI